MSGTIQTFMTTSDYVYHIESDAFTDGNILFSDGSSVKTTDGVTTYLISGSDSDNGYREGQGQRSRFHHIAGFIQIQSDQVVLVDSDNHCFRHLNRVSNQTSHYLGNCTNQGYQDGERPLFDEPHAIIRDSQNATFLIIVDEGNNALRVINALTNNTRTLIRSFKLKDPRGLTQHALSGDFYITVEHGVVRFNYESAVLTTISVSADFGFRDGDLSTAEYNFPNEIIFLSPSKMLLADRKNNRLRIIDMQSNMTSSVCSGEKDHRDSNNLSACGLNNPRSLYKLGDTIYVGEKKRIRLLQGELD